MLDEFDNKTGAVINGKAASQVGKIDFRAIGPSFYLVRPEHRDAIEVISLEEIDKWRLGRLSVVGATAKELEIRKDELAEIIKGVILGPIFPVTK